MEARVAVLEQIARDTRDALVDIRQDMRDMRQDFNRAFARVDEEFKDIRGELKDIRTDQKTDFRVLFGALISSIVGLAYIMARGFHWLQ